MLLKSKRRAVGLDVGTGAVKALTLERHGRRLLITGAGAAPIEDGSGAKQLSQAINTALATAGADGQPVVAAVGGPDVVIRQITLPPLRPSRIVPALLLQHREFGLLSPADALLDVQIVKRAGRGAATEVLAVSAPRNLVEERRQLLRQAAVRIRILDVEPLALMNAALCLTELEAGELLVALTVGRRRSVLCLFSDQGPVVARHLDAGAEQITGRLRQAFGLSADAALSLAARLSAADLPRAEEACLETLGTMAEAIRLSLAFYRSEYDREALPRYTLGGWVGLPPLGRWLADRLALDAPFEIMDPLQALPATTHAGGREAPTGATPPGSEFLLAFGLALRGL